MATSITLPVKHRFGSGGCGNSSCGSPLLAPSRRDALIHVVEPADVWDGGDGAISRGAMTSSSTPRASTRRWKSSPEIPSRSEC